MVAPPPGMPPMPPGPGGGPPMPPGMMGGGPPPPPPGPPPDPIADENIPEPKPEDIILQQIATLREELGDEEVRSFIVDLDDAMIDRLREWQLTIPHASAVLDDVMPPDDDDPEYPRWFIRPPKPEAGEIDDLVRDDWNSWDAVREQIHNDLLLFHQEVGAAYKDFDSDKDELYVDDSLSNEVNTIASKIQGKRLVWQFDVLDAAHEQDAQKAEDFVAYCYDGARRRHARAGNMDLQRELAVYLMVAGYACARTGLNLDDEQQPFPLTLADPATVVPTWDERGLVRVTRSYQDTVANVIAAYDDGSGKVRRLLTAANDNGERRKLTDLIQVKTYDDRWWRCVMADGKEVIPVTAHEYGFVPWIIKGLDMGEPMALSGDVNEIAPNAGYRDDSRLNKKHTSYFHFLRRGHQQKEAILSKMYTMWKHVDKPGWLWSYDEFAKADGIPEMPGHGKIVPIRMNHEELTPAIEAINPNIFGTLIQAHVASEQRSRLPLASLGGTDDANTSGNAIEGMIEAGTHVMTPVERSVEAFCEMLGEMWLTIWRDWGHLYQGNTGEYGATQVPYLSRKARWDDDPAYRMTPEVIRRCGTRVSAMLSDLRIQGLAPLGNAVSIWKNMGLMTDSDALSLRGVANPDDYMDEVAYGQIRQDPTVQALLKYKILREQDPELAELYRQHMFEKKQEQMQMQPPMMPGQMGPPGMTPDVNTSAMDLSALGMGAQGPTGRPVGSGGPAPPPPGSVLIPPQGGPPMPIS